MRVKSNDDGDAYSGALVFSTPIVVKERALHSLSFYTIFACYESGCENTSDLLTVKTRDIHTQYFNILYQQGTDTGRYNDYKWNHEFILFEIPDDSEMIVIITS